MSGGLARWSVSLALGALLTGPGSAAEPFNFAADRTKRTVVITFDDLPAQANSFHPTVLENPKALIRSSRRMLRKLRRMNVPAAGFVNSSFRPNGWELEDVKTLLKAWDKAGAALGNHTTSHWDYHQMKPEAYFADILSGQEFLDSVLGTSPAGQKYFRAPYLHHGRSQEERQRLAAYLDKHSYTIAPVTIDLQDWMFAHVYAWAISNHDWSRKHAVVKAYMSYLEVSIEYYALLSAAILGRQAPHVVLLHANALNFDHIKEVIQQFERHDFEFISLDAAMRDPVYQQRPAASGSWIRGWQYKHGLPSVEAPDAKHFLGTLYADYLREVSLEKRSPALQ